MGFSFLEASGKAYNGDSQLAQLVEGEVLEFSPRLDKNKKPMAFVKIRTPNGILDRMVMFHRGFQTLIEKQSYKFSIKKNVIEDVSKNA